MAAITDTSGPDNVPTAWLETAANAPLTNWPGKVTYLPDGRVSVVGTAEGYVSDKPVGNHAKAVTLDLNTGRFNATWNPFGVNTGHIYDGNPSVALNGYVYRLPWNTTTLYRMDVATGKWAAYADVSSLNIGTFAAMDVFPTLGAAGSIIWCGDGIVRRHDIATKQNTVIASNLAGAVDDYNVCSYHPGIDAVVLGGGKTGGSYLHVLDRSSRVTQLTTTTPPGISAITCYGQIGTLLLPDPFGRKVAHVTDCINSGRTYRLDLMSGKWTETSPVPSELVGRYHVCATAVKNKCLLFLVGRGRQDSTKSLSMVWAYKVV